MYCCFLDLKGAYDRVQRHLLWQAIAKLGIYDKFFRAAQSLCGNYKIKIHINGKTGSAYPSQTGVKQGCQLSPTLFGTFLDGLCRYIKAKCPSAGPGVGSNFRILNLDYADDVLLLATSPDELQQLIDTTEE